ncbi:MetQ/NlpA family ABC transporter substrate-binding protein [Clostridium sp.]|uniref:MetQ/NlpA family ABC transporter substrate-binding protein n=1 Tax=Clostridium sp. TaxID=1506 RepID=UPI0034644206
MIKIRRLLGLALVSVIAVSAFVGCSSKKEEEKGSEKKVVKIGVTGDGTVEPKSPWAYVQKQLLEKENIEIKFVGFGDYNRPNLALAEGEIDLNAFQHVAFLETFKKDHNLDIVPIGNTNLAPMGIYSKTLKDPKEIKEGGKVIVPNDKSNEGRALLILEEAGLIELKENVGYYPTLKDIVENKKNLKFVEVAATQIPRSIEDGDLSVINSGVASQAGLDPQKDPIFLEDVKSEKAKPYINVIAARGEDKDNETYKKIVEYYNTDEVKKLTIEYNKGGVVPAW